MDFVYKVLRGETVESIGAHNNVSAEVLRHRNKLNAEVREGMRLVIPCTGGRVYVVQPFDTLETIAVKQGVTRRELVELNQVEKVFLGQRILLP